MQAVTAGRYQENAVNGVQNGQGYHSEDSPKPHRSACSLFCQSQPCRLVLLVLGTLMILSGFAGVGLSVKLNQHSTVAIGIPLSGVAIFVGIVLDICSYALRVQLNRNVAERQLAADVGRPVAVSQGEGASTTSVFDMSRMSAGRINAARQRLAVMQDAREAQLAILRYLNNPPPTPTLAVASVGVAASYSSAAGVLRSSSPESSSTAALGSGPTADGSTEQCAPGPSYHFHSATHRQFQSTVVLHHGLLSEQETALNAGAPPYTSFVLLPAELASAPDRLSDSSLLPPSWPPQVLPQLYTTLQVPSYEQALQISEPVATSNRPRETSLTIATVESQPRRSTPPWALNSQLPPPPSYDEVCSGIG